MKNNYAILAIDLGTSGAKVSIVTLDGLCLGWTLEKIPVILAGTGGAEQDANIWWRCCVGYLVSDFRRYSRSPDSAGI